MRYSSWNERNTGTGRGRSGAVPEWRHTVLGSWHAGRSTYRWIRTCLVRQSLQRHAFTRLHNHAPAMAVPRGGTVHRTGTRSSPPARRPAGHTPRRCATTNTKANDKIGTHRSVAKSSALPLCAVRRLQRNASCPRFDCGLRGASLCTTLARNANDDRHKCSSTTPHSRHSLISACRRQLGAYAKAGGAQTDSPSRR